MKKCPVCKQNIQIGQICENCNFENSLHDFINREDAIYWENNIVEEYRKKWLKTLKDFQVDSTGTILEKYTGLSENVVIPYGIKKIKSAFTKNNVIRKVSIPETVTCIDIRAFYACKKLERVDINTGVVEIKKYAFRGCNSLKVEIPLNVKRIEEGAFSMVVSVSVPEEHDVFEVNQGMLIDKLNGILLAAAFERPFMEIVIPENVLTIGEFAFNIVRNFPSNITLPYGLLHISSYSLLNICCNNTLVIPATVKKIEDDAFASLGNVDLEEGNSEYIVVDNLLIEKRTRKIITVCDKKCSEIDIPPMVKDIANRAFAYCVNLKGIKIPKSIKSIGHYCFYGCKNLGVAWISESVRNVGHAIFDECEKLNFIFLEHEEAPKEWISSWKEDCNANTFYGVPMP